MVTYHRSFSESVKDRFKAYGWQYLRVEDGNDLKEIANAIEQAKANLINQLLLKLKQLLAMVHQIKQELQVLMGPLLVRKS